jgi:hypothetical protein
MGGVYCSLNTHMSGKQDLYQLMVLVQFKVGLFRMD